MKSKNKPECSGTTIEVGYRVEVRCAYTNYSRVLVLADEKTVNKDWRVYYPTADELAAFPDSVFGNKQKHQLLSLEGAWAIAWKLVARHPDFSLECRLVQYELEVTHSVIRKGTVDADPVGRNTTYKTITIIPPEDDPDFAQEA